MTLDRIVENDAVLYFDKQTDFLIAWDGAIQFSVYAGRFNGEYDSIDVFYHEAKTLKGAKEVAKIWIHEHSTFSPGP